MKRTLLSLLIMTMTLLLIIGCSSSPEEPEYVENVPEQTTPEPTATVEPSPEEEVEPSADAIVFDLPTLQVVSRTDGYYRNLNLTAGGTVHEMRFTWHSQSPTGMIRLYEAGAIIQSK